MANPLQPMGQGQLQQMIANDPQSRANASVAQQALARSNSMSQAQKDAGFANDPVFGGRIPASYSPGAVPTMPQWMQQANQQMYGANAGNGQVADIVHPATPHFNSMVNALSSGKGMSR